MGAMTYRTVGRRRNEGESARRMGNGVPFLTEAGLGGKAAGPPVACRHIDSFDVGFEFDGTKCREANGFGEPVKADCVGNEGPSQRG